MTAKKILVAVSIFAMVVIASGMIAAIHATGGATIWTDKPDYSPEEVVTIFGSGFLPGSTVWLNLTRPNGWVDTWSTLSDSNGTFTTTYQLDGIQGTYLVVAADGTNTATMTFTDAPKVQSVTVSPTSRTASPGSSAIYSIAVTRGTGNDAFQATFSVVSSSPSIPAGAISFGPATITCTSSCPGSTLTISTASLSPGTYTFKVRATRVSTDLANSPTITMIIDATGPVMIPSASPSPNANGWNNGDVTVSWTVSDPESGIVSSPGCGTTVLSSETPGTTITCTATNGAGLSNSASVTVKIDKTGPSVTGSRSPSPNSNGWNNGPVTVSFTCTDALSGVASSSGPTTLAGQGQGQSITGSCTDIAGNSASATVTNVNIDLTAPVISGSRSPSPNTYGWNSADVTVSFTCSDSLSGVATGPVTPQVVTTEGSGQSRTGTCTDQADNSASATIGNINIDKTPPSIKGSRSPDPNAGGWSSVDVTVSFACSDTLSAIASSPSPTVLGEGAGQAVSGTCADMAGNSASATVGDINIDKTAPMLDGSRSPGPNGLGWNNEDVIVSFTCSDTVSGVSTEPLTPQVVSDEGASQSRTAACIDRAGNSATATVGDINIDKTPPVILGSRTPGPNAYGWNNGPVTVHFECSDGLSGVDSVSSDSVVSTEIVSLNLTGSCADMAGNTAETTVGPVSIDLTPPIIEASRTPAPNLNRWNNSPVTVSFSCTDDLSGVELVSGPVTLGEGAYQSATGGCADFAGNSAETTMDSISVDLTPPNLTGARSPESNANGWNNGQVTVAFECADALSGVEFVSGSTILAGEGVAQSVTGVCTDYAGNFVSVTVGDINIDLTPPSISGSRDPGPNSNGWNNGPVAVGFTCSDNLSGVAEVTPGSTIDVEIIALSLTGSCTDNAGNSATTAVGPISIDMTAPDISGSKSPSPNASGWNNVDVTVHFDCFDALSGVDLVTPDQLVAAEAVGQSRVGTCVDLAGNSSNTTVGGINVDKTAPIIDGSRSPAPNSFGWNNGPVTIDFVCADGLSGVSSVSHSQTIDTEIVSLSLTGICTDLAGNAASASIAEINVDLTPPTISGSRSPQANGHGWNNEAVTVTFLCEDGLSGIASSPTPAVLSGEGSGQWVSGTCEDKAGNVATGKVEGINIDKTPPSITASRTPDPNVYGWNNQDITVHFECSDSLSGVSSVTGDQTVSTEGAGQSVIGTCTDSAGNSVSTSIGSGINIDKTAPSIIGSRTPGPNAYGWNNANVAVYFSCSDALSGVSVNPTSPQMVMSEDAGQSRTATCTDFAGNMASATIGGISIDKSSPTLAGSRSPGANSFGWNNVAVTVSFTCSDALSGVALVTGPTTLSSDGAGQSVSGTCMDKAGNSASASVGSINIDIMRPIATISNPTAGSYALNALVPASWLISDSLSGIDPTSVTATAPNGANVDTSTIGTKTFIISAVDKAGNYASQTVTYQVIYSQTCGRRILSPLEQVSSSAQLTKAYKRGSTLPIKFQLCDASGNYLGTAIATVHVYKVSNSVDLGDELIVSDSGYSDSGSNVCRYDSTANQYIYNLSTKTYTAGTYRLEVHLDDGTTITTYFQLAK